MNLSYLSNEVAFWAIGGLGMGKRALCKGDYQITGNMWGLRNLFRGKEYFTKGNLVFSHAVVVARDWGRGPSQRVCRKEPGRWT